MKTNKQVNRDLIILILSGFLLAFIIYYLDRDKTPDMDPSAIPPVPSVTESWQYDFYKQKWVKTFMSKPRAKGINEFNEPYIDEDELEDELQEYLEEHVDGYLEDTYWGEEYDLNLD